MSSDVRTPTEFRKVYETRAVDNETAEAMCFCAVCNKLYWEDYEAALQSYLRRMPTVCQTCTPLQECGAEGNPKLGGWLPTIW